MKLKNRKKSLLITVDGPGGVGKSTAAKALAKKYKVPYLTSGLCYRWAAKILIEKKPKNKISFIKKQFSKLNYNQLKKLNLHTPEISSFSAIIAKKLSLRQIVKRWQKDFVYKKNNGNAVVEGRDSHLIFRKAMVMFYLKANLATKAKRRYLELKKKNIKTTLKQVKVELLARDSLDIQRKHSPLILSRNHVVIATDILNQSKMIKKMSKEIDKRLLLRDGKFRKTKSR